ncbi:MAG: hypothetical protein OEV49_09325 [candidate division Zixibacteria bacterium]|nr:hypothetical protein [candidate division Zixibacteria bacterium]MDH3936542.1 hypothetical protein [candidate division Zixibacteria bacterium]MDH4032295.1 hypothetical protein [candidate division Zixibacteria bacterium]
MDISSGFYLDLLLNLIGYLAAGALVWTVYPIVAPLLGRRPTASPQPEAQPSRPLPVQQPAVAPQFMRLQQPTPSAETFAVDDDKPIERPSMLRPPQRRDRVDIIRIAREMLKAGADNRRIQQVLPVSEAELALLTMQNQ